LAKRTSRRKMREALDQRGNAQTSMLILHKVLVEAKDFYTPQPQEADYQRLHEAYQKALMARHLPTCNLQKTQERLAKLGASIRSYSNSNMRSLNQEVGQQGSELLDRFSSHYNDPLESRLKLEQQEQAEELKQQVHQQLQNLSPSQMESFRLKTNGHSDLQIAKLQSISASTTVKRRRDRIISKALNIPIDKNFSAVADIYMEVAQEFFKANSN
jgi:DNA-binding NarL/FixJ family response regulator